MAKHNCESCRFRATYDKNQRSIIGRIWRWHINWCPGWKKFLNSLPEADRELLYGEYGLDNPQEKKSSGAS